MKLLKIFCSIFTIAILIMAFAVGVSAYNLGGGSYIQGDLLFKYVFPGPSGGELDMYLFRYLGESKNVTIPAYIINEKVSVVQECKIKGIADSAFKDNTKLVNVTIPSSIFEIRSEAFSGCSKLENVNGLLYADFISPDAFRGCVSLKDVKISAHSLGTDSFANCTGLETLTYSSDISSGTISNAFKGCTNLKEIIIEPGVTEIPDSMFESISSLSQIEIPNTVLKIGENIFNSNTSVTILCEEGSYADEYAKEHNISTKYNGGICGDNAKWHLNNEGILKISGTGDMYDYSYSDPAPWYAYKEEITSLDVEDGITGIGIYAFYNCSKLVNVVLSDTVESIGKYCFNYCTHLADVHLGEGLISIGSCAFRYCDLSNITIPKSVREIQYGAFEYCDTLKRVDISDLTAWLRIDFASERSNPLCYGGSLYIQNILATTLIIPDEVSSIPPYAFNSCSGLEKVTVPNNIKLIGEFAFADCSNLIHITLPDSLVEIGANAFCRCKGIEYITLPNSLVKIGANAFSHCSELKDIVIPNGVEIIENGAFSFCSKLKYISIGENVVQIFPLAFHECRNIEMIYWNAIHVEDFSHENYVFTFAGSKGPGINLFFGHKVERIPQNAFYPEDGVAEAPKIVKITLCKTVTYIGLHSFEDCAFVEDVYFYGTKDEWKYLNTCGDDYKLHYLEEQAYSPVIMLSECQISAFEITSDCIFVISSYDDSKLTDFKSIPISEETVVTISSTGLDTENATEIRAYLWESITSMRPLCEAQSIQLSN